MGARLRCVCPTSSGVLVAEVGLLDLLRARYSEPEWYSATEITLGRRRADFVAANLWESRGRKVIAVEMKISRSDWLRELKDPAKQERIFTQCDLMYLAVTDASIVQPGELPDGWGLLVQQKSRLVEKVRPKVVKGAPTREFWTRLLQREQQTRAAAVRAEAYRLTKERAESLEDVELKKARREAESFKGAYEAISQQLEHVRREQKTIAELAAMSDWERARVIEAAGWVSKNHWWKNSSLVGAAEHLAEKAKQIDEGCATLRAILERPEESQSA